MGFLDSMAAGAMGGGNDTSKVAVGLMQAVQEQPGGFGVILDSFRSNGLGAHVDTAQAGGTPQMSPEQVQTGLQGMGLLESVAAKAGVSPKVAKMAMATRAAAGDGALLPKRRPDAGGWDAGWVAGEITLGSSGLLEMDMV